MLSEVRGMEWNAPMVFESLELAKSAAKRLDKKIWCRIQGAPNYRVEIYPGGRSIAWPLDGLERRRERQAPLEEGHHCKHVWDVHTDSDPCAAGMHIESYVQCLRCGQIREDRIKICK
jgi:hypothetical protein